jgi:hypothetical protein
MSERLVMIDLSYETAVTVKRSYFAGVAVNLTAGSLVRWFAGSEKNA